MPRRVQGATIAASSEPEVPSPWAESVPFRQNAVVERTGILAAATAIGEVAAEHAAATHAGRRLARPVVDALSTAAFGGLMAPTAMGGGAAHPGVMVEAIERISAYDASAGWCAGIGVGSNHLAGIIPEVTARELFTDLASGGAGPFAPGGPALAEGDLVHVAGRWAYSSNCHQAVVSACGVVIMQDGAPKVGPSGVELGLAFLSSADFAIEETWNTEGLRGTGSHDLVADVRIASSRISSLWAQKWPGDSIFRLRTFDVLGPSLAAVPLGIGRAALDFVAERAVRDADGPPKPGPKPRFADNPWHQVDMGKAEVRLRAARSLLLDAVHDAFEAGERGDSPPRATTALIGLACGEALGAAKQAVETAVSLIGTDAVREGSPLLKLRRDIDAAGSHVMFSPMIASGLSRELAGIPTAAFPFLDSPPA
jgi:indole-3-acetate monooxygenase